MAIIGIDLGTTNSLVCVWRNGQPELIPNSLGNILTPSVVSADGYGNIYTGAVAKERLIGHPSVTAASFKRYMGTDKVFSLAGRSFRPQELSSFILRQLKEDAERVLGEAVTEAVISVPAYFNDNQRYATKEAGLLAGIKVERLVNEPSAAALASSRISGKEEQSYLVFDFGGGTLDISVVDYFDNVIEIIAVSGDNRLGGDDFDLLIARHFCDTHHLVYEELTPKNQAVLLRLSEACKGDLTSQDTAMLRFRPDENGDELGMFLTNMELAKLCPQIFDRISAVVMRALKDSERTIEEIDEVVLVGGSSKMPVISYYLEVILGKKPQIIGSPDEVVAMGAGIYAGIKERREEIKELVLTDICPFTLGINVVNRLDAAKPIMSPIIERNSILPTSKRGVYTNAYDKQKKLSIEVYQGEAYYCGDNIKLGEMELDILPTQAGGNCVEVCFTYDINGILEVEVTDHLMKKMQKVVLTSQNVKLSQEELDRRLKELLEFKLLPPGGIRTKLVLARGERLFTELIGEKRLQVTLEMDRLSMVIANQNDQMIAKVTREVEAAFDFLEGEKEG